MVQKILLASCHDEASAIILEQLRLMLLVLRKWQKFFLLIPCCRSLFLIAIQGLVMLVSMRF